MHFIVTGGAGFIGSHLTEQLLLDGHCVTVIDNLTTGNLQNLPQHSHLQFLQKNVLDCQPEDFQKPVDGIAHLAATPSVTESWLRPLKTHHNNLSATIAMLLLCQALKIPRFVLASSAAVYGNTNEIPIAETQKTAPISPYGLQKLASEQYANLLAQKLQISVVFLRLFNVFGPRQVPTSPYSGVISIFTYAMQQGLPITIYGNGQQTRDFVYVRDVAIAFAKALTVSLLPGSALTCNVGTGQETSLLELVTILQPHFNQWNAEVRFASPRTGDIKHSRADISRISSRLNFSPQWSVRSGLRFFVESLALAQQTNARATFSQALC